MSAPRASANCVGAQSVTIQAAELPQALATGVVNSFMSSGGTGYDSKVWETLTHFYDTQAWIPKDVTFVNKAAFDALDKADAGRDPQGRGDRRRRAAGRCGRRRPAGISTSSRPRA